MTPEHILKDIMQVQPAVINQVAFDRLNMLLERCNINLVSNLTGITRRTFYRWLDTDRSLEEMDHKIATYFLVHCAFNGKVQMLMERPPLSHRRLAGRVIEEGDTDNE